MGPDLRHLLAAVARRTGPAGVRGARAGARRCAETVGNDHDTVAAPPRGGRAGGRLGGVRTSAALVIGGLFRRELTPLLSGGAVQGPSSRKDVLGRRAGLTWC